VCAAPSFILGMLLCRSPWQRLAMFLVVNVFVVIYLVVERSPFMQRVRSWPQANESIIFGFVTRILTCVLFPIGMLFDYCIGLISLSICEVFAPGLQSNVVDMDRGIPSLAPYSTFQVALMTLVHGVILNLLLWIYIAGIYLLRCRIYGTEFNSAEDEDEDTDDLTPFEKLESR
jgi:hypothetical protein